MKRPWLGLLTPLAFLPGLFFHHYPQPDLAGLVVLVANDTGHGSGSYLGNGYVLTAKHVIDDSSRITVMDDDLVDYPAEVVSVDPLNDVAVLRIRVDAPISVGHVDCRAPRLGEAVSASGNPFNVQFITTWGRVGGLPRDIGIVASTMVLSMTVLPGMSGGPVRDWWGDIIGINTDAYRQPGVGSFVPLGFSVPSNRFCPLLYKVGAI